MIDCEEASWNFVDGLETGQQYEAFEYYRDSSPRLRSLASTARATGHSYGTLLVWSKQCMWPERVASFDEHRARERDALRLSRETQADEQWAAKRAALLEELHALVENGLAQTLQDLRTKRTRLRPSELKQLSDLLLKYGNLANGDATERVDVPIDLSQATPEQLEALEAFRHLQRKDKE